MHEIVEEISANNEWRDGEFAILKIKANTAPESEIKLWNRMCIPMIYAHWEGFVMDCFKILLKHLNSVGIHPKDAKTNFIVVGLEDAYNPLKGKQSFQQRLQFTDKFQETIENKLTFRTKINTKSNLNSSVFQEICEMFCLNYEGFKENERTLDRLVTMRNKIAHGENSFLPDAENIEKFITCVKDNMDALLYEIDDFLENERYFAQEQ